MLTKIDITDIFSVLIFAILCVGLYFAFKFYNYVRVADDQLAAEFLMLNGIVRKAITETEDFRRDFNLKFDNELASKVESIMKAGERPANMIKVLDEETGEMVLKPMDHGW